MSNTAQDHRNNLKELTKEAFLKEYTRSDMEAIAELEGVEDPGSAANKGELYDWILEAADMPDPALRGVSDVDAPCNLTWEIADKMWLEARDEGRDPPRRKDVITACRNAGIAYYTARTQYQSWFTHTNRGQKLIADGNTDGVPMRRVAVEEEAEDE